MSPVMFMAVFSTCLVTNVSGVDGVSTPETIGCCPLSCLWCCRRVLYPVRPHRRDFVTYIVVDMFPNVACDVYGSIFNMYFTVSLVWTHHITILQLLEWKHTCRNILQVVSLSAFSYEEYRVWHICRSVIKRVLVKHNSFLRC